MMQRASAILWFCESARSRMAKRPAARGPAERQPGFLGFHAHSLKSYSPSRGDDPMRKFAIYLLAPFFLTAGLGHAPVLADSNPAIHLSVDATLAPQKILRVHMVIPAVAGPLTLYYPKWIQGVHAPIGPISNLAGLKIFSNGQLLSW
jgi:hypothetical protein